MNDLSTQVEALNFAYFNQPREARQAYKAAAEHHFSEFARAEFQFALAHAR